jgi:hypothetical protein
MVNPSDILKELSDADRALWMKVRAEWQAAYLKAHGAVLGFENFIADDTHFLDALDHKLADLFSRAGRQIPLVMPTSTAIKASLPPIISKAVDEFESVFRPSAKSPAAMIPESISNPAADEDARNANQ